MKIKFRDMLDPEPVTVYILYGFTPEEYDQVILGVFRKLDHAKNFIKYVNGPWKEESAGEWAVDVMCVDDFEVEWDGLLIEEEILR